MPAPPCSTALTSHASADRAAGTTLLAPSSRQPFASRRTEGSSGAAQPALRLSLRGPAAVGHWRWQPARALRVAAPLTTSSAAGTMAGHRGRPPARHPRPRPAHRSRPAPAPAHPRAGSALATASQPNSAISCQMARGSASAPVAAWPRCATPAYDTVAQQFLFFAQLQVHRFTAGDRPEGSRAGRTGSCCGHGRRGASRRRNRSRWPVPGCRQRDSPPPWPA